MKRFYSLFLISIALVSGAAYGMERKVDIRDYDDVVKHLTTTAGFRAEDRFEGRPWEALLAIEDFILSNGKHSEKQYVNLCISYLNHCFALRENEFNAERVERTLRERFTGDSPKALYYARYKQYVIAQLLLDKLHPINAIELIEEFGIEKNKDYIQFLCVDYLNRCFTSDTCTPDQITMILKERFVGNGEKAAFYAPYRYYVIRALNLIKLHPVIMNVCLSKNIDDILDWLLIFDNTDTGCEELLVKEGLSQIIDFKGNALSLQPVERVLLQKCKDLQGRRGKELVDKLREKEQEDQGQVLTEAEKVKIAREIVATLTKGNNPDLQLIPVNCLKDIDNLVRGMIQKSKTIKNGEALLNTWNTKFAALAGKSQADHQRQAEQRAEEKRLRELEQIRQNEEQRNKRKMEKQLQKREEEQRQYEEAKRRQQQRIEERQRLEEQERLEQQRQAEEQQRRTQPANEEQPQQPPQQPQQPQVGGQPRQPGPDASQGIAALFATITASKLIVAAVVVGVCYWGYTKYKAYKAAPDSVPAVAESSGGHGKATTDKPAGRRKR